MIKLLNRLIALFINVLVLMLRMVIPKNKKLAVAAVGVESVLPIIPNTSL